MWILQTIRHHMPDPLSDQRTGVDNRNPTSTHNYKYSTTNTPNYNCVTDQASPEKCHITSMKRYPVNSHERQVPFEILGAGWQNIDMLVQRPAPTKKTLSTTTHTLYLPINTLCQMRDDPFTASGIQVTYFYAHKINIRTLQNEIINATLLRH